MSKKRNCESIMVTDTESSKKELNLSFANNVNTYIKQRKDVEPPLDANAKLNDLLKNVTLAKEEYQLINKEPIEKEYTVRLEFKKYGKLVLNYIGIPEENSFLFTRFVSKRLVHFLKDEKTGECKKRLLNDGEAKPKEGATMEAVARYDYDVKLGEKSISYKIRLYHRFHYVSIPYSVTIGMAKEYNIKDLASDDHFDSKTKVAKFKYDEKMDVICFYFKAHLENKDSIFRLAIKNKNKKVFLDIECEDDLSFASNILGYVVMEYYSWQVARFERIREWFFGNSVAWMFFVQTALKNDFKETVDVVCALNNAHIMKHSDMPKEVRGDGDDETKEFVKTMFDL